MRSEELAGVKKALEILRAASYAELEAATAKGASRPASESPDILFNVNGDGWEANISRAQMETNVGLHSLRPGSYENIVL